MNLPQLWDNYELWYKPHNNSLGFTHMHQEERYVFQKHLKLLYLVCFLLLTRKDVDWHQVGVILIPDWDISQRCHKLTLITKTIKNFRYLWLLSKSCKKSNSLLSYLCKHQNAIGSCPLVCRNKLYISHS